MDNMFRSQGHWEEKVLLQVQCAMNRFYFPLASTGATEFH